MKMTQKYPTCIVLVTMLFIMITMSTFTLVDTYYIVPTPNHPLCPKGDIPCITLSQYAHKLKTHKPSQNESLTMLPGNHTLDQELYVSDINHFEICTNDSSMLHRSTLIICSKMGRYEFRNIVSVNMRGITAIGCGVNSFISTNSVILKNCSFQGGNYTQNGTYTGFYVDNVASMRITECNFSSNNGNVVRENFKQTTSMTVTGGALTITDSNVFIESSHFKNNTAYHTNTSSYKFYGSGGVVYAQRSRLYIKTTVFSHNIAGYSGGAICGSRGSTISIHNSTIASNLAYIGGFAAIYDSSKILTTNSVFTSNIASTTCGVFYAKYSSLVSIYNSTFSENRAYVRGGVISAEYNSTIDIRSSAFYGNKALPKLHAPGNESQIKTAGGVLILYHGSRVLVNDSRFNGNKAGFTGGVISAAKTATIQINSSSFNNNSAGYGGVTELHNDVITVCSSTFVGNRAEFGGGGVFYADTNANILIRDSYFTLNIASKVPFAKNSGSGGVLLTYKNTTVVLERSMFKNNSAYVGAVMFLDFTNINFNNCTFKDNLAEYGGIGSFKNKSAIRIESSTFQHNTGEKAAGSIHLKESTLKVYDSTFISNYASHGGVLYADSSIIMMEKCSIFNNSARLGGAIHCSTSGNNSVTSDYNVELIDSSFYQNSACTGSVIFSDLCSIISRESLIVKLNQGIGAIYLLQSNATFSGENTTISDNFGSVFAFASNLLFNGTVIMESNVEGKYAQINKCIGANVNDQRYQEGGAITAVKSDVIFLGNVMILTNHGEIGGGLLALQSNINILDGNMTISNNTAATSGGGIYVYQSQINFNRKAHVSDNKAVKNGGGMHAIASTLQFTNGTHHVSRNEAGINGGGMYLELDSKVFVIKDTREKYNCTSEWNEGTPCIGTDMIGGWISVAFEDNIAQYGGAICINDDTSNSDACKNEPTDVHSPTRECFFQTLSMYWNDMPIPYTHTNNTYFINNHANKTGDVLYGGLLNRCTLSPFVERYTNMTNMSAITYFQNITNIDLDSIKSKPTRVCLCSPHGIPDCTYRQPTIRVKKGETFTVFLVAVDQVNHTLPAIIRSSLSSQSGGLKEGETIQSVTENCTHLNYTVFSPHTFEQLSLYAEGPCKDIGISSQSIGIEFIPCDFCPVGFKTPESSCVCKCDPQLEPLITQCFNTNGTLLREGEFWIDYITHNNSNKSGYLIYPHCPFDYCYPPTTQVYISLNAPNGSDAQCLFNRSKLLCGQCKPGHSLSLGSTHCRQCSNYWLLLLLPFIIAGILLVALILKLNLTVAEGTLNGLVLYANIIATNSDIFLPFEKSNFLTVFVSWINLDFGIETCFYNGMDAYVKTWLQFAFPLYIILLVVAIIVISDYSPRFARLFTTSTNPVATLATLILLSHAKLLRTIITALSFIQLNYPDGSHEIVWLLDANVPYLQGKHIPLFIAAVLTALVGLVYSFFLFSWQWATKYAKKIFLLKWMTNTKILAFIDAYHAPYNPQHRYWTGLTLLARTILYLIFAVNVLGDPRVNLLCIACISSILIFGQKLLVQRVYKSHMLDIIENIFILNLILFALTTFYLLDAKKNRSVLAYISTSTALLMFLATLIYHTYKFAKLQLNRCRCKANGYEEVETELENATEFLPNELDQVLLLSDEGSCTEIDIRDFSYNHDTDDTCDTNSDSGDKSTILVTANHSGEDEDLSSDETKPLLDNEIM